MPLSIDTCAAMHIGDRAEQQDRVAIVPHPKRADCLLAVLADGMGGHTGGAIAAEQVIIKAKQNFTAYEPAETPEDLLRSVIEEAHVVIKLTRFTSERDPHSTAVVMLLQSDGVYWAHCGDSRLYHFRHGELIDRSQDHSLVGELVRTGKITDEMALDHPQRNLLLSCLGSNREPRIDFNSATVQNGDCFILCSDGLWGLIDTPELGRTLDTLDPRAAARVLINAARQRGHGAGDNISLAIVKVASGR